MDAFSIGWGIFQITTGKIIWTPFQASGFGVIRTNTKQNQTKNPAHYSAFFLLWNVYYSINKELQNSNSHSTCCFHMFFIWRYYAKHWSVGSPIKTRWLMVTNWGTVRRSVPCSLKQMEMEHLATGCSLRSSDKARMTKAQFPVGDLC